MMKVIVLASVLALTSVRAITAAGDYSTLCSNVVAALSSDDVLMSPTCANQLHSYLEHTTIEVRSLAKLALSIHHSSLFEKSLDHASLDSSYLHCTNVLFSSELPSCSWHRSVASLLYASCLGLDNRFGESFSVCTNALAVHLASPTTSDEQAVWLAIARHEMVAGISTTNALNLCASLSLIIDGKSSALNVYTNDLPVQAMEKIKMALE